MKQLLLMTALIGSVVIIGVGLYYFTNYSFAPDDQKAATTVCDIIVAKNGSGNFNTIQGAVDAAIGRQTICVDGGTYHEQVVINKPNLTLTSYGSETPVIDGRYSENLFYNNQLPGPDERVGYPNEAAVYASTLPGKQWDALLSIEASNTVWNGINIINSSGEIFQILENANDNVIKNSRFDFSYNSIYIINSSRNLVQNNEISRGSMKYYDSMRVCSPKAVECVAGTMKIENKGGALYAEGNVIRGNSLRYTRSEGIAMGYRSKDTIVEDNLVVDTYHVGIYATKGSQNTTIRNNLVIHTNHPDANSKSKTDGYGTGIVYGDETQNSAIQASKITVYNNVVIGSRVLFEVRNNKKGYNTQLDNSYIGYNTFIAGPSTFAPIRIIDNQQGRPHTARNMFENNIILSKWHLSSKKITPGTSTKHQLGAMSKRNNIWSTAPVADMMGSGDTYLNETSVGAKSYTILANPYVTIPQGKWGPVWNDNIFPYDISNYKNLPNYEIVRFSAAHGGASVRTGVGGINPPSGISKDYYGASRSDLGVLKYYDTGAIQNKY